MIYCVWYPSGGFGHFINAILTLHGENFVRPKNLLTFSSTGDSHSLDLVVPKYIHESWPGGVEFSDSLNYSVLIDNGINNEGRKFTSVIPNPEIVKICFSDYSWPIVAKTSITKATRSTLEQELPLNQWDCNEPWAIREKYFLYLRDHKFRYMWKKEQGVNELYIDDMLDYKQLYNRINKIVETTKFEDLWREWRVANDQYISPVEIAQEIILNVKNNKFCKLTHIVDHWTQAVLYYFIQIEFNVEVPHNDYSDWFTSTDDIVTMLKNQGVIIDSI